MNPNPIVTDASEDLARKNRISRLVCMDCGKSVPLYGTTKFTCPCGGLYDVEHDLSLRPPEIVTVKNRFDGRAYPTPDSVRSRSGVWRFHELIMPSIRQSEIVSLGEGTIPLWPAGRHLREWIGGDLDLWILPEGLGPTGSFKDFGGTVAISVAKASGIKSVICASTGDTSAMAAAYAADGGMSCMVVLPKGLVTDVQLAQPLAHGAKIVLVPGSFDDCMRIVREIVDAERAFPINSINPTRIEGHQASVFLAAQFFGWSLPDAFVVPVGNGSNSSSIGKGMRLLHRLGIVEEMSKLIGVQSEAACPLARSWAMTLDMSGEVTPENWLSYYAHQAQLGSTTATAARIGNPVSYKKVIREVCASKGAVLKASEDELNRAVLIAGQDGHLICPQTGTALAGLRHAVCNGTIEHGQRVVVVSTATGLKFPEVPAKYGQHLIREASSCETNEVADIMGV